VTTTKLDNALDFATFGDYAPPPTAYVREGNHSRLVYPIDGRITADGSTEYGETSGRYHLYVSHYCPWAQRPLIALQLRGLAGVVSWSAVDPVRDGRGWAFRDGDGHGPDPVNDFAFLRDAYLATEPGFDGHISVPALWDRHRGRLVSNHYPTLTLDLETRFAELADPKVDLYPAALRADIDSLNDEIIRDLSGAAYAARAAGTQEQYDAVSDRVFGALERYDQRLGDWRYLHGNTITDSDILLYVSLVRFDLVAAVIGRLHFKRLVDYPNLWAYARDLYQQPAFGSATNFDHICRGTFRAAAGAPSRIVPTPPSADWDAPSGRGTSATP
jgi:glutathionyl-hydroquinone reductase